MRFLPFTNKEMPDDLCQKYVDDVYGSRDECQDEESFVEWKVERANLLRKWIIKRLKEYKKALTS